MPKSSTIELTQTIPCRIIPLVIYKSGKSWGRAMNAREQRVLAIAALCHLRRKGNAWRFPRRPSPSATSSTSKSSPVTVPTARMGAQCKHCSAVEFTLERGWGLTEP